MKEEKLDNSLGKKSNLKKILLIVLLAIVLIIGLIFAGQFMKNKTGKADTTKIKDIINGINKDKLSYIFVEINPSLVLTIRGNKIEDIDCLNDDCLAIYQDLDIKGKDLENGIDVIYNVSKAKGFDTSNGVKIKCNDNIDLKAKDYITIEYIDTVKEQELLNSVINNDAIKNLDNDDYYVKLWKKLKKDGDYDKVYTCNMNDNKELECHIILETGINNDSDFDIDSEEQYNEVQQKVTNSTKYILGILEKFNFDVRNNGIYLNGIRYTYFPLFTINGTPYKNVLRSKIVEKLDDEICKLGQVEYIDGRCEVDDGYYVIELAKVNLLKQSTLLDNIFEFRIGTAEHARKYYEMYKQFN